MLFEQRVTDIPGPLEYFRSVKVERDYALTAYGSIQQCSGQAVEILLCLAFQLSPSASRFASMYFLKGLSDSMMPIASAR